MKLSEGYVLAAERVFLHDGYSCLAVRDVFDRQKASGEVPEVRLYRSVFCDGKEPFMDDRFLDQIREARVEGHDMRELRMNLLCLMAACCEDFK